MLIKREPKQPLNIEANDFAMAILMPEKEFRKAVRSGINKIEDISKMFKVTTLVARLRAKKIGMSGHGM